MTFRLFGAFVFALSAAAFSLLSVAGRSFHFAHVAVVAEVNDDDDRNTHEQRPDARSAHAADDKSRAGRTGEITDRNPEKVPAPHVPDRFAGFEGGGGGADQRVAHILDQTHQTENAEAN